MAKRNRRKKGKPSVRKGADASSTPEVIANKAREDLDRGNYRRAREGFRRLMKSDEDLFAPLYLEATCGYVREMLDSDRHRQAEDVMGQARNLLGDRATQVLDSLMLRIAGKNGDWTAVAEKAAGQWDPSAELAARTAVVDALVLAFEPVALEDSALTADVAAIHQAIQALTAQDKTQVEDLLRPLGRQSPLAEWKLLVKSLLAFQTGEQERALLGFRKLRDAQSVPGRTAAAYLELFRERETVPSTNAIVLACHCLGEPEAAQTLPDADKLWRQQKLRQAYERLAKSHPEFPCGSRVGLWSGLTDQFLYRPSVSLAAMEPLVRLLATKAREGRFKSDGEKAALQRWVALEWNISDDPDHYPLMWEGFLAAFQAAYSTNSALASRVHAKIGHDLLHQGPHTVYRDDALSSKHGAKILEHLNRSLDQEPMHLPAFLDILETYQALGDSSARNKLLDKLTKLFPDEKKVLLEAGRNCVKRKAFVKGLEMLRQARQANPLDKEVLAALINGLSDQAFQYYRKGEVDRGRMCFIEMEQIATNDADDFDSGLAYVLVRQRVFERLFAVGDADDLQSRALKILTEHTWRYAESLYAGFYFDKVQILKRKALAYDQAYLESPEANGADALRMIAMFQHWLSRLSERRRDLAISDLQYYLETVVESKSFDRQNAREIVLRQQNFEFSLYTEPIIAEMLRQNSDDAFFCIAKKRQIPLDAIQDAMVPRLEDDLARAAKAGDRQAMELGRTVLDRWEKLLREREDFMDGPMYGAWDDDDDDDFDDFGNFEDDPKSAIMSAVEKLESDMPGIRQMLEEIAFQNPRERQHHRKEMGMPKSAFADFVALAEQMKAVGCFDRGDKIDVMEALLEQMLPAIPLPRAKKKLSAPKAPSPPKQDQLDLFG